MMRKRSFAGINLLLSVFFCLLAARVDVSAQETKPFSINESPLPAPTSPVTDLAGVLDAATKQSLERRLIEFRDKTNPRVELAVAIVNTTGDRPIFDYSLAVARGWGIGSKEDDNPSALLFIAVQDRKYFTQVSKDLEDELPDGVVGQLQRQYLVPAFRQGNYGKGVTDTIEAYIRTIESKTAGGEQPPAGETAGTAQKKPQRYAFGGSTCGLFICLAVIFIIFLSSLSRGSRRRSKGHDRDRWGGGGFGGGGGGSVVPWIIGSAIANSIANSSSSSGWGSDSSSSDWGGGGGDSWGGFGGGGDFGGGGAGGDW
jgi:uncharacterized protein